MGSMDQPIEYLQVVGGKPDILQLQEDAGFVQKPHHDAFPVGSGDDGNPDIDVLPGNGDSNSAVLGESLFGDVQPRHDLHPGGDARLDPLGRGQHVIEDSIDAVTNYQIPFEWLDVDIACPLFDGLKEDRVHQANHRSLIGRIEEIGGFLQSAGNDIEAVLVEVLDDLLGRIGIPIVYLIDGIDDSPCGHDHGFDLLIQEDPDVVQRIDIQGI